MMQYVVANGAQLASNTEEVPPLSSTANSIILLLFLIIIIIINNNNGVKKLDGVNLMKLEKYFSSLD